MKKITKIIIVALLFGAAYFIISLKDADGPAMAPEISETLPTRSDEIRNPKITEDIFPEIRVEEEELPEKISIDVPFTSQAPFGKWDPYHQEACEEASIIMLKYYLDKKPLTPEIAEREILAMIHYENKNLGHYEDSDAEEMVKIAEGFYGIKNLKIIYDFEKEDIKKYLAKGKPIIVPAAGRLLGNPNFTAPGPLYHALVLKGYDGDTIIVNDPGTRRGEGYRYDLDILYGAIHDFPGDKKKIEQGRKAMIILK
ncbi:MAG TPA: hypothetical protein DIT25_00525 [Candidatus Moranbacteria bacterium]|nr:hypothetical protein [Candidatus Moranbacteria bacterium]